MDTGGKADVPAKAAETPIQTTGKAAPVLEIPDEVTRSSSDMKSEENNGGLANFFV